MVMKIIDRVLCFCVENKWKYRLHHNCVRVRGTGNLRVGSAFCLSNSSIFIDNGSTLTVDDDVIIENCQMYINGNVKIGHHTQIKNGQYIIEDGKITIGHHSKLTARRFWIRFGGEVRVGNYTNINDGSEVRCDESVSIGDYNQISYNVNIWDTNTHYVYPSEKRREIAEKYWPYFGKELERPKTKQIHIGDDCWIGENSSILKGTNLSNNVIVGFGTILTGVTIEDGKTVMNKVELRIL